MIDYLTLGPTPAAEPCEQLGPSYDPQQARAECETFKRQLQRLFPDGSFAVRRFPHDFGTYLEVVALYDVQDEAQQAAAFAAERRTPARWDDEALEDLKCLMSWARIARRRAEKSKEKESERARRSPTHES